MDLDRRVLVVIEARALELAVVQPKPEGANKVQPAPGVGAKPDDVARIRWNFRLEQYDIEHFCCKT